DASGSRILVPAVEEWGIPSEPYVFVVDADGDVAAKFEGPADTTALAAAPATAVVLHAPGPAARVDPGQRTGSPAGRRRLDRYAPARGTAMATPDHRRRLLQDRSPTRRTSDP